MFFKKSGQTWDVAIVGAGPAGSTAAYHIAKAGHRVLLLDKKDFPREKVCGDGLIPDTLACLKRMNLLKEVEKVGKKIDKILAISPSRIKCEVDGNFITLKRYDFDAMLLKHAKTAGAIFLPSPVSDIDIFHDAVGIRTPKGQIMARAGILATGADLGLAQKLGLAAEARADAAAVRCYIKSSLPLNHLIFSFDRQILPGYGWIFPLPNNEFNVGYGIFRKRFMGRQKLKETLGKFMKSPTITELLKHGEVISEIKGATLRCGLSSVQKPKLQNLLLVGETIGTTFPFSGEGIGKAMESGEMAAEAINFFLRTGSQNDLALYADLIERDLKPKYRGYELAERWITNPWIADFLTARARKSKFLRQAVTGIIDEKINPEEIFSLRGVLRSLF